ncbi:MAG: hypothetical protein ACREFE_01720 [Limisphaerales bacterium]
MNAVFKNYLDEYFQQQPLQATSLGDHRFDNLPELVRADLA